MGRPPDSPGESFAAAGHTGDKNNHNRYALWAGKGYDAASPLYVQIAALNAVRKAHLQRWQLGTVQLPSRVAAVTNTTLVLARGDVLLLFLNNHPTPPPLAPAAAPTTPTATPAALDAATDAAATSTTTPAASDTTSATTTPTSTTAVRYCLAPREGELLLDGRKWVDALTDAPVVVTRTAAGEGLCPASAPYSYLAPDAHPKAAVVAAAAADDGGGGGGGGAVARLASRPGALFALVVAALLALFAAGACVWRWRRRRARGPTRRKRLVELDSPACSPGIAVPDFNARAKIEATTTSTTAD